MDNEIEVFKAAILTEQKRLANAVKFVDTPRWIFMFGQIWREDDSPERLELFRKLVVEFEPEMLNWLKESS